MLSIHMKAIESNRRDQIRSDQIRKVQTRAEEKRTKRKRRDWRGREKIEENKKKGSEENERFFFPSRRLDRNILI